MKILLVCNAGMSTSMLVQKMEKAAQARGMELEIAAEPFSVAEKEVDNWDVVMLGPQVRHQLKKLQQAAKKAPISVIDMRDYGTMNGEHVLDAAIKIVEENQ